MGPLVGSGGGFRFGVATAATQIEDMNTATDWYLWTAPAPDGLGKGTFVGEAVMATRTRSTTSQLVKGMDARLVPLLDRVGAGRAA